MAISRQDRINLHKNKRGIVDSPEPSLNQLDEGIPEIRTVADSLSGKMITKFFVKKGNSILQTVLNENKEGQVNQSALWYISDEISLTSAVRTKAITVSGGSFLMDTRILVTTTIVPGSMDVDVGIGTNTDVFVDGWDGSTGSIAANTLNAFGRGSGATETGVKVGLFFQETDTVDVKVNTVATSGKIKLMALILKSPIVQNILNK